MPARRLLMRKIRKILRLRHEQGLSHREIAQACAIGPGTVSRYLERAASRGLGWPLPPELDDTGLAARLFPRGAPVHDRARPDCAHIHRELRRDGVTLQLLWGERYDEALEALERGFSPGTDAATAATAHYLAGRTLLGLGRDGEAATHFQSAIERDPHHAEAIDIWPCGGSGGGSTSRPWRCTGYTRTWHPTT